MIVLLNKTWFIFDVSFFKIVVLSDEMDKSDMLYQAWFIFQISADIFW